MMMVDWDSPVAVFEENGESEFCFAILGNFLHHKITKTLKNLNRL